MSYRRFLHLSLAVLTSVGILTVPLQQAGAYSRTNPAPGFDPNALISDALFTAYGFSSNDTQSFLNQTGSWLANYTVPANQDVFYQYKDSSGNCANSTVNVPQVDTLVQPNDNFGGISAGQLIADQAHKYGINPQVVLATLQKESSALTRTTPLSDINTAWVLGVGWDDKMASCQYDQNTAKGMAITWGGTGQQIAYAAHYVFRKYFHWFDDQTAHPGHCTDPINWVNWAANDQTPANIVPNGCGTYALYKYTPYVYDGNYNFWNILPNPNSPYNWFQSVPPYSPPLARDPADGSVYVIDAGARWPVSGAGFVAWNFSWNNVVAITTDQAALPVKGTFTELAVNESGSVYSVQGGVLHAVTSPRIFAFNNLDWSKVKLVSDAILTKVPSGLPLYEGLTLSNGDGTVYLATNGTLFPVSADMFYNAWALSWKEIARVPWYVARGIPVGQNLSRIVVPKGGDGTAFLIDQGYGYKLTGAQATTWGLDTSHIVTVGVNLLNQVSNGGWLGNVVIQNGGDGTIYLVQNGKKQPLSRAAWLARGFTPKQVQTFSASLLNLVPTGDTLSQ